MGLRAWLEPIVNPLACLPPVDDAGSFHENPQRLLQRLEALLQKQRAHSTSGEKQSLLKGQGLEFADVREYIPGDDVRKMDWNVYARTLTPHIKEFHEEKQLTIWLMVDFTPSMFFGQTITKAEKALELAGLMGLMALHARHKLGCFILGTGQTEIISPKSGEAHLQQIMHRLQQAGQNIPAQPAIAPHFFKTAWQQFNHVVTKQATVISISDFCAPKTDWVLSLGQLSRSCRLMNFFMRDPVEGALPDACGVLPIFDPETGETTWLDTDNPHLRSQYHQTAQSHIEDIQNQLKRLGPTLTVSPQDHNRDILLAVLSRQAKQR